MSEIRIIDARDTFCPGPLMELISYMKRASVGDEFDTAPISIAGVKVMHPIEAS